jgi:hypothetical protein
MTDGLLRLGAGAALAAFAGLPFLRSPAPPLVVWTASPMVKVRPADGPPGGEAGAVVQAGRNEFEPFQVVLRSDVDLDGVDVEVGDLVGPGGRLLRAENAAVYLEGFLDVRRPSSIEGGVGEWPDMLLPRVDRYAHERRSAFPFHLRAGRTQPLWVELYVPIDAAPGAYTGEVRILVSGARTIAVPVDLTVWKLTLPSTSSLPTTFGLSGLAVLKQHRGGYTDDDDLVRFSQLYARALLLHRVSAHGGSFAAPPFTRRSGGGVDVDWARYDREVGPLLDGAAFGPSDPLPGARATTVDLRSPAGLDEPTQAAYWREWVRHFKEKGWLSRLFDYLWDEPTRRDFAEVASRGGALHQAAPEIPTLVTAPFDAAIAGGVSIWAPVVNCLDDKPGTDKFCEPPLRPEAYAAEKRDGKKLWWYQSCGSHGCNIVGGTYFTGWPSYVVDVDATAHRAMEWLTWKYGVGGELYFNTVEAFPRDVDAWADVYLHGGNGDGTLFYPGRPERIGGTTDIPIESVRLKLIREGLEDYEYFTQLAALGRTAQVDEVVGRVVRKTYDWEHRPAAFEDARRELGEELNRRSR